MYSRPAPSRPRRSAFAAAFFSFLIPGLGQAYLGRWVRALLWAVPWLVAVLLIGGWAFSMGLTEFATNFLAPSWLQGLLIGVVVDLLYRLASLLDAYWLGRGSGPAGSPLARIGSVAGLAAILLVLVASHVAVARPVIEAYQALEEITGEEDDPLGSFDPNNLPSGIIEPSQETLAPGETATPEPSPTPTPTQGPSWNGRDPLNILLIGADSGRAGYQGHLTDTLMTVSIDPRTKQVAFITLPRDTTRVPLPSSWRASREFGGAYPGKINGLFELARRRPDLFPGNDRQRPYNALKGALGELLGIRIDYYVAVDLQGFRDAIEALGGIIIDVHTPVYDTSYPSDDGRGVVKLYIPQGMQRMNGKQALGFARARHGSDDFRRSERQQQIVTSLRNQTDLAALLAPGKIAELFTLFRRSVRTDVDREKLPAMVQLASEINLAERISIPLSPPTYTSICYPCPGSGLFELLPDIPAIRRAVANVFKGDRKAQMRRQRIAREGAVLQVLNGTPGANIKSTNIADYLGQQGFSAAVPPVNAGRADRNDYTRTVITAYNGAEQDLEETLARLREIFKVDVQTADDPTVESDIVVIVGTNTPSLRPER
jgi:LCP family protein required for cell wall assembly